MKRFIFSIFTLTIGFIFILYDVSFVGAQMSNTEEFTLEEITVTAQKREENQQKVPMTMEVISADDIKISGKNDLDEILANIPSVVIGMEEDGLRISLRGMSDDTDSWHGQPASMPTVALNMDGVYSNRKDSSSGLYDLERVEVLYGPQSTLYASNSPGGIVNVVTANPKLDVYEASGILEYGNYATLHTEGVMNAPLSDMMALRAAFSTSIHDGYLSNGADDEDSKSARLRALFQPNESLSFVVTGEITKRSGRFFGSVDKFIDQDELDDPWFTDDELDPPSHRSNKKVYGRMDLDMGIGTISLVPSYSKGDGHEESADPMMGTQKQDRDTEERAAELRLSSSADSFLTWIVGLNYYKSSDILDQKTYEDTEPTGEYMYGTMDEEEKAAFTNITYPFTDRFRTTVGYRQSWDTIHVIRDEGRIGPDGIMYDYVDYNHEYSDPDYKLGIEYDLSENSMIYADYSTSYRTQGMASASSGTIATPPPEKLKAYTFGSKNRFLDNKLQMNASAYYYDYKNYFVTEMKMAYYGDDLENPMSDSVTPDPNSYAWGAGHMMGIELQTNAIITPRDTINFSASYLKSEWDDLLFAYYYDWATDTMVPPGQSSPVPIELYPLEDMDYGGKSMTKSPDLTLMVDYKHIFNLPSGGSIESQINGLYKGDYQLTWDEDNYPYNYQEAFYKLDFSVNYIHSDGKWTLSGYVRNITDYAEKRGYTSRGDTRLGSPRTYGAVLTVKY